jgi:CBS domain-containing protein
MMHPQDHRPLAKVIRHKPVMLTGDATVQDACATMHRERIGAIMVVNKEGGLEGIFTGRDVVRLLAQGKSPARARLSDCMTRNPAHIPPSHSAIEALRLMSDGGFRHVPLVDQGRVVGIVSHGDFRHHELARLDEESGYWERL